MKTRLFTILLLIFLISFCPVFADTNEDMAYYKTLIGQKVIFLDFPDYKYFDNINSNQKLKDVDFSRKIATITNIEKATFEKSRFYSVGYIVEFTFNDNTKIYSNIFFKKIDNVGFISEMENAQKYIGKTVWNEYFNKYTVENIKWGRYDHSPLVFVLKTSAGRTIEWSGSYSTLNDQTNSYVFSNNWSFVDPRGPTEEDKAKATEIISFLRSQEPLLLTNLDNDDAYYVTIIPSSIVYLTPGDSRFDFLEKNHDDFIPVKYKKRYPFVLKAKDLWSNKELIFYTAFSEDSLDFNLYDGKYTYYISKIKPTIEDKVKANELISSLSAQKPMIITNSNNEAYYITIISSSIEYLVISDYRYGFLQKKHKNFVSTKYTKCYPFVLKAKDIWSNKEMVFYTSFYENGRFFNLFDVNDTYHISKTNPALKENLRDYYMTVNDASACPLKILAYRIYIDEYDTVCTDLVVKNTSSKGIAAFTGTFLMYDKMGHAVTWGGGDNAFNFLYEDDSIPPKSASLNLGSWELRLYENTYQIKPYIREIKFTDGSMWPQQSKKKK
jgi:hypothetical protein